MKKLFLTAAAVAAMGLGGAAFAQTAECAPGIFGHQPGCGPNAAYGPQGWSPTYTPYGPDPVRPQYWAWGRGQNDWFRDRDYQRRRDLDRDGIRNNRDRDRDGDGIRNNRDRYPDDGRFR